jgi:hypothetical protein
LLEEQEMQTSIRSIGLTTFLVTGLLGCTLGADVQAWGAKGHRIARHMAHDLLTPETQAAIQQLMGSDQLATFSLYLDERKDQMDRDIRSCPCRVRVNRQGQSGNLQSSQVA